MKPTLLTTDANFIAAAALGALSFGAMLSLSLAQECEKIETGKPLADKPECLERDEPAASDLAVKKFNGPEHVITIDKDGEIKCGHPESAQATKLGGGLNRVVPLDTGDVMPEEIPKELICAVAPPPKAINPAFETDLYAQLRSEKGNVFFSPYSISECMGMVYLGAEANTAKELGAALHFGAQGTFGDRMQFLRHHVVSNAKMNGGKLNIANALCVTGSSPDEAYQKQIRQMFEAEVFSGGLAEINGWVKEKTEGNIEKILEQLNPNTACVLLNAVYFKGDWQQPFKASKTREGDFHVSAESQVKVKFMSQRNRFKHVRAKEWIAVELPYKSGCSMVLLMPAKADGMAALESSLDEAKLNQVYGKLQHDKRSLMGERIELVMPKFKIATSYDLIPSFKQMGVRDAFSEATANFTKMYDDNSVFISQIKHKATLEVDEMGSVASAATAVEMATKGLPAPVPEIRFDRPFLVTIKENATDSTLFIGRISDPTK